MGLCGRELAHNGCNIIVPIKETDMSGGNNDPKDPPKPKKAVKPKGKGRK